MSCRQPLAKCLGKGNLLKLSTTICLSTTTLWTVFQPSSHANLELLKKAQKNLEIRTSNLETSKICIKSKQRQKIICFGIFFTLLLLFLVLFCCFFRMGLALRLILQPWGSRCAQETHGWRLSLVLPPFPSQISFDEFGCYEHRFLDIPLYLPKLFGNFEAFWLTVRLRGKAVRPWVGIPSRESHGQTVRIGRFFSRVWKFLV